MRAVERGRRQIRGKSSGFSDSQTDDAEVVSLCASIRVEQPPIRPDIAAERFAS